MPPVKYQVVYPIVDLNYELAQKIRVLPPGPLPPTILGPFLASGYAQLVMWFLTGATPVQVQVQGSVLPLAGTWVDLYNNVALPGVPEQIVVDLIPDYIQIILTNPAPVPATVEISGNLYPIEALESNRALASGDKVEIVLGANGTVGRQVLVAAAAPVIVIPTSINRKSATLRNWGTQTLYWGYTVVEATPANGFPLDPKESYTWKETTKEIWASTGAGANVPYATDQQLK